MQRIDGPTRSATLPAPAATGTGTSAPGFFQRGDPVAGTPPTTLDIDWANGVQEELATIATSNGAALDKANHGQCLAALDARYVAKAAGGGGGAGSGINPAGGEFAFNGGGFCKVGAVTGTYGEGEVSVTFPTPFPNACLGVQATAINASGSAARDFGAQVVSWSKTGCVVMLQLNGSTGSNIDGFTWDAKGY